MTSLKVIEYRKEFLKCLNSIEYGKSRYKVFQDFIEVSTISIFNTIAKNEELEKRYFEIIGQYKNPNKLAELLAITAAALEKVPCDFLGDVYMFGEFGNRNTGQVFTPYHVAEMMSLCTYDKDNLKREIEEKGFITVSEPCCGAGVMLIAFAHTLLNYGFNPQQVMWFELRDIDINCCYMAYIQTSLLGLSGQVQHGNTITMETWQNFTTPFSVFTYHKFKSFRQKSEEQKQIIDTKIQKEERKQEYENIKIEQLSLFS